MNLTIFYTFEAAQIKKQWMNDSGMATIDLPHMENGFAPVPAVKQRETPNSNTAPPPFPFAPPPPDPSSSGWEDITEKFRACSKSKQFFLCGEKIEKFSVLSSSIRGTRSRCQVRIFLENFMILIFWKKTGFLFFSFSLFEGMSAIELMDPKMDAGMVQRNSHSQPMSFDSAVKVNIFSLSFTELYGFLTYRAEN